MYSWVSKHNDIRTPHVSRPKGDLDAPALQKVGRSWGAVGMELWGERGSGLVRSQGESHAFIWEVN